MTSPLPTPRRLTLERLAIADLRNLEQVTLEPASHVNVITGNNGHGKTSVLEAIYLLATSRSFRTARLAQVVRHGALAASLGGRFVEAWPQGPLGRTQSATLRGNKRDLLLDGDAPPSLAHFATRSPVVLFEPSQLALSAGPSAERRLLLDRLTLFAQHDVAIHRARYNRALKERQRLLATLRGSLSTSPELDAYEALLADHGAAITRARAAAVAALDEPLRQAFARIAAPDLELSVRYAPGGSDDVETAAARLFESRSSDAQARRARFGPHRDDLILCIDGHEARLVASQGQHRALTLALKSAELASIARARGVQPILLLDDVSSELDSERTAALFEHLAATESQIFLTTTHRDLIVTSHAIGDRRRDFEIVRGALREVAPAH